MSNVYETWGVGLDPSAYEVGTSSDNLNSNEDDGNLYDPLAGKMNNDLDVDEKELLELNGLVSELGITDNYFDEDITNPEPKSKEEDLVNRSKDTLIDNSGNSSFIGKSVVVVVDGNPEVECRNVPNNSTTSYDNVKMQNKTTEEEVIVRHLPLIKKVIILGLVPSVILFLGLSLLLKDNDSKITVDNTGNTASNVSTSVPQLDNILILNDGFGGLSDYVEDLLIVEKKSILTGDSLVTMVCGNTTKNNVYLNIPVSIDKYNSLENGSIVKVRFKQLKINNIVYNTDVDIGGVIE